MKGIRESQGSQGEPFNLRQAEIIIGQGVTNAINGIMNVNQLWNISMHGSETKRGLENVTPSLSTSEMSFRSDRQGGHRIR